MEKNKKSLGGKIKKALWISKEEEKFRKMELKDFLELSSERINALREGEGNKKIQIDLSCVKTILGNEGYVLAMTTLEDGEEGKELWDKKNIAKDWEKEEDRKQGAYTKLLSLKDLKNFAMFNADNYDPTLYNFVINHKNLDVRSTYKSDIEKRNDGSLWCQGEVGIGVMPFAKSRYVQTNGDDVTPEGIMKEMDKQVITSVPFIASKWGDLREVVGMINDQEGGQ